MQTPDPVKASYSQTLADLNEYVLFRELYTRASALNSSFSWLDGASDLEVSCFQIALKKLFDRAQAGECPFSDLDSYISGCQQLRAMGSTLLPLQ